MDFLNNSTWDGIINDIPDNIDEFLADFFNVDYSAVEQGDLPLLSPNTLQLLDDFTRELTGNPPPLAPDNLLPLQSNEVASHSPIIEQCGGGGGDNNIQEEEVGGVISNLRHFPSFNSQIQF